MGALTMLSCEPNSLCQRTERDKFPVTLEKTSELWECRLAHCMKQKTPHHKVLKDCPPSKTCKEASNITPSHVLSARYCKSAKWD